MKIRNLKFLCIAVFAMLFTWNTQAQDPLLFYGFNGVAQNQLTNPAYQVNEKFTFGFPNVAIYLTNSQFAPMSLFLSDGDINQVLTDNVASMTNDDRLLFDLHTDLFFLGFKAGRSYISMGAYNRNIVNFNYPSNLIKLAYFGNAQFINQEVELLGNQIFATNYIGYHLGYQYKSSNEKWTIGGRVKFLSGIADATTEKLSARVGFFEDGWTLNSEVLVRTSNTNTLASGDINNVIDNLFSGNTGLAFDLGLSYEFTKRLRLSTAVTDMGSITWRNDLVNYESGGDAEFQGLRIKLGQEGNTDNFNNALDSLQKDLNIREEEGQEYTSAIPFRYNAVLDYSLTRKQRLTGVYEYIQFRGNDFHRMGVQYHLQMTRWLHLSGSYGIMNNNFSNFGAGFMFKFLGIQTYLLTDQINGLWQPENVNALNIRLGVNFSLGVNKKKEEEKRKLREEKREKKKSNN